MPRERSNGGDSTDRGVSRSWSPPITTPTRYPGMAVMAKQAIDAVLDGRMSIPGLIAWCEDGECRWPGIGWAKAAKDIARNHEALLDRKGLVWVQGYLIRREFAPEHIQARDQKPEELTDQPSPTQRSREELAAIKARLEEVPF